MGATKSITETLATLLLQRNVPLEAVEVAGEIIAMDARAKSYDKGQEKRSSFARWSEFAERYEVVLQRTQSAADDFAQNRDGGALLGALEEIKQSMASL